MLDRVDRFFARPFMSEPIMPAFPFEPMSEGLAEWAPRLDLAETDRELPAVRSPQPDPIGFVFERAEAIRRQGRR